MAFHFDGGPWRPVTTQNVSYTGTAGTITNAVGAQTRVVRITATSDAFIVFGVNPTATSAGMLLTAGLTDYFHIAPGEKVSAIQSSASGTLYVTEMTM